MSQTGKEVTLFLTACGRPDLLEQTLKSFLMFNTYPIKEGIIMEDSGQQGINDFVHQLLPFPCQILYNSERLGQMRSIEQGLKLLSTPYVFHCEEDWEFYDSGFIEKSFEIIEKDSKVTSVWLRSHHEILNYYGIPLIKSELGDYFYTGKNGLGSGSFSFNPGLRKLSIALQFTPYTKEDDEGTLCLKFREIGMTSAMINHPFGYVKHIGWGRHIY
jgi:hypothetical protein